MGTEPGDPACKPAIGVGDPAPLPHLPTSSASRSASSSPPMTHDALPRLLRLRASSASSSAPAIIMAWSALGCRMWWNGGSGGDGDGDGAGGGGGGETVVEVVTKWSCGVLVVPWWCYDGPKVADTAVIAW